MSSRRSSPRSESFTTLRCRGEGFQLAVSDYTSFLFPFHSFSLLPFQVVPFPKAPSAPETWEGPESRRGAPAGRGVLLEQRPWPWPLSALYKYVRCSPSVCTLARTWKSPSGVECKKEDGRPCAMLSKRPLSEAGVGPGENQQEEPFWGNLVRKGRFWGWSHAWCVTIKAKSQKRGESSPSRPQLEPWEDLVLWAPWAQGQLLRLGGCDLDP